MTVLLLFLVPLIGGLACFFLKDAKVARGWALLVSLAAMALSIKGFADLQHGNASEFTAPWLGSLGSSFSLSLDCLSGILSLLTGIAYPIILLATWKTDYRKSNNFFALMLLTQAGLMGVFTATDALLFYFFWELALVPVYFLCSGWGGERRIPVTFKFFIYTFTGSVLMLIALLYLYSQTPEHSFSMESFYSLHLSNDAQSWLFWMLFIAFAIKMPIFPLHTWQPDTYEQSPTAVTMVLSGLMVKMGVFGLLRWVLPVVPAGVYIWGDFVMGLSVTGILYASVIALKQDDIKRLVAYSSIAHMGLMCLAIFADTRSGYQGMTIQLFHHGINIIGLWIVVELIERQFGTRKLSELGGLAQKAPGLAILLVIVALANVALPLTNSFAGEFLMFNGIWGAAGTKYNVVFAVLSGLSIILGAAYTLRMIQKIFFGAANERTAVGYRLRPAEMVALLLVVALILWFGVYPQPLIKATGGFVESLLKLTIN
jgi:NADH-quinone oxidoreductase subunit M